MYGHLVDDKGALQYSKKRFVFSINASGSIGYPYVQNINLVTHFILYAKINSKWIIDINLTVKIIKFLEDDIGEYANDFGVDK